MADPSSVADGATLRLQFFGGFCVAIGLREVEAACWRPRKARSLVKLLALVPGHQLRREQPWDLLWPDIEPEAATDDLQRTLHVARRAFLPEGVATPSVSAYLHLQGDLLALAPRQSVCISV
jgi:DNA-binding SARP family transcriptional activator